ncbi:DgyrCDS11870 [Dimorphilus gyrociliatus]|uniref:Phosphatidylinositol-glycan biosynthesis class X protein n=1 Tax=Dimorphilus gyrociliatus TaxID=2664684 RepID=A0A7I8W8C8_9ANNE|nr:DgyrCDS11870 [Dimorphilus gyrociliatus]
MIQYHMKDIDGVTKKFVVIDRLNVMRILNSMLILISKTVCSEIDIRRWSEGTGFHRTLSYVIQVNGRNCSVFIEQVLPSGAYIDNHELKRLGINASVKGLVDIEAPEFSADFHTMEIYQKTSDYGNLLLNIPVHLRYHISTNGGKRVEIFLSQSNVHVECSKGRSWNRTVKSESFQIPTGNLNDSNTVIVGTCMCSTLSLFIVLYGIYSSNN